MRTLHQKIKHGESSGSVSHSQVEINGIQTLGIRESVPCDHIVDANVPVSLIHIYTQIFNT
jgi:hypothetical protein